MDTPNEATQHQQVVPQQNTNPLEYKTFKTNEQFVNWQSGKAATIHHLNPVAADNGKVYLTAIYQENM